MGRPLLEPVSNAGPRMLRPGQVLADVTLVAVQTLLLVLVCHPNTPWDAVPGTWDALIGRSALTWLALASGAAAFAAAVLCGVCRRLTEDGRMAWVGAALGVYGVVGIPVISVSPGADPDLPDGAVAPFIGHVVVALALVVSVQPWARRTSVDSVAAFGVGLVSVLALLGLGFLWPGPAVEVTKYLPLRCVVALVWLVASLLIAWRGIAVGTRPLLRLGLGMVLVAASHAYWLYYVSVRPTVPPDLAVHAVRLFGVLVVLLGATELVWRALRALGEEQQRERVRLHEAEAGLARLTERNHELRNGIAGLAGVTTVLDRAADENRRQAVRCAVAAELSRLDALLRETPNRAGECELTDALEGIAGLWRSNGLDVRCDIPPGLAVRVPSGVLIQVVVNLLSNCARHAPGSPVRVAAERRAGAVVMTVADSGPGVPPPAAGRLFAPGFKGPDSTGRGLGLSISRRLLGEHGAGIAIRHGGPGCVVVLELPVAGEPDAGPGAQQLSQFGYGDRRDGLGLSVR